jgi:hypothetical protein
MTSETKVATWEDIRANCAHERKVLVEGGYEREWSWTVRNDGVQDFSDEGDGSYRLICKTCLLGFPLPDDWEWE